MRGRVEVVGSSILEAYQFRAVHLNPVGPSVRGDRMGASPPSWSTLPHHFEAARRRASEDARFTEVKRPARRREAVDVPTGHDCYSTSEVNRVCTCFLRSRPAGSRPSREASARRRPRAPLRSALIRPRSEPPLLADRRATPCGEDRGNKTYSEGGRRSSSCRLCFCHDDPAQRAGNGCTLTSP